MPLLNREANHAIWQKLWSTIKYSAHCLSLDFGSECLQRRKKSLSVFVLDSKTKEDDKIVLQRVSFELSREQKGLLLQSRKWLKDEKASEKPIETTAESSFTSFSERSELFKATKSREVQRHIKIVVYCSGKEASRKTPGSGVLSILPGKCRTFRKCIE